MKHEYEVEMTVRVTVENARPLDKETILDSAMAVVSQHIDVLDVAGHYDEKTKQNIPRTWTSVWAEVTDDDCEIAGESDEGESDA